MAARVAVIAVRDLGRDEFVDAFPGLAAAEPRVGAGWTWASFGLFQLGGQVGPAADAVLARLERPGLQAWTEDGALWYLTLHAPGRKPFRHVHWFRYNRVATGREKAKQGVTLRKYLDQLVSDLPEAFQPAGRLPTGSLRVAMTRHLERRANALSRFLRLCRVPHEPAAVRDAITGRSVTEEEWGWDVGNLPRLLDAIGLGDAFPDWREEIESSRRANAEATAAARAAAEAPPPDLVAPILERLGPVEAPPVKGGSPTVSPTTLWLLPWSCHNDVELGFIVRPSRAVKARWPRLDGLSVVAREGEWHIGHPWCSVWQRQRLLAKLGPVLQSLPAGTRVEMVSASVPEPADQDAPVTAGDMRFVWTLARREWKLTHAHPAATRQEIEAAAQLFDWVSGRQAFTARDDAEAAALIEQAREGNHFGTEKKDQPAVSGRRIRVRAPWRPYLAMLAFRHRFATGPWDTVASRQADAAFEADWDRLIADVGAKFSQALAAPRDEELIHRGQRSAFRRARMSQIKGGPALAQLFRTLYPARDLGSFLDLDEGVRLVDESMAKFGLTPLGDMVCEAFGEIVIRGYAREADDVHGLVYAGTLGQFAYEFNTQFTDGSSLTTSINPGLDVPEIQSRHVHVPHATVEELFERHAAGIAERLQGGSSPAEHGTSLAELAGRIDQFLVRTAA
jgi:hypothetical protein